MMRADRISRSLITAWAFVLALILTLDTTSAADALSPAAQRGQTFLRANCTQCHAIDRISESPLKIAPPFRALHLKYPVETLRTPLLEGVVTNHPTMPAFRLDPGQATDVITYLKTLEQ
jgi:mono/diheme cytochrome c family protein